jgi:hypothetical protein
MDRPKFGPELQPRLLTLLGIVAAAAAARLIPHPPNFTPIAAIALFGGVHFRDARAAFGVPFAAMMASDLVLAMAVYGPGSLRKSPLVYLCFALIVAIGRRVARNPTAGALAMAVPAGSLLFYLVTNLGVWVLGTRYPPTLDGLAACYLAALPFLRNLLLGDLFYTAVLFGGYALAGRAFPALRGEASVASSRK